MTDEPTIFVIDDDPSIVKSLGRLFRAAGYRSETFTSAGEFLKQANDKKFGCLVLDMQLPELTGLQLQQRLSNAAHALSIVFITGHASVRMSVQAMKYGAIDFLEKPLEEHELLQVVERGLARSRLKYREQLAHASARARVSLLTPREYQVLCGVIAGRLNKQIASDLGIGEKTVKVHRGRVMKKIGVRSVASLVQAVGGLETDRPIPDL